MKDAILLQIFDDIEYAIVMKDKKIGREFIACWSPSFNDDGEVTSWGQGHYFTDIIDASKHINNLMNPKSNTYMDIEYVAENRFDHLVLDADFIAIIEKQMEDYDYSDYNDHIEELIDIELSWLNMEDSSFLLEPQKVSVKSLEVLFQKNIETCLKLNECKITCWWEIKSIKSIFNDVLGIINVYKDDSVNLMEAMIKYYDSLKVKVDDYIRTEKNS